MGPPGFQETRSSGSGIGKPVPFLHRDADAGFWETGSRSGCDIRLEEFSVPKETSLRETAHRELKK